MMRVKTKTLCRVGNSLGAGDAKQAHIAMHAARAWVPVTWLFSAGKCLPVRASQIMTVL